MPPKSQKPFSEAANEILQLALSLKESIDDEDFEDSDDEDDNCEVSIKIQNASSDVKPKTSHPRRNLKRKSSDLQSPHPKRLRGEAATRTSTAQSENVTKKLYDNLKSVSEAQEKSAEVDKIRIIPDIFDATNKTSRLSHQDKRKIENLEVDIKTQNSIFDATNKTSRLSHQDKRKIENLEVGIKTQNSIFDATIKTSRNYHQHKRKIEKLEIGVETQNSIFDATNKTSRNSHQHKRKIEKLEVGVETQNSTFDATIKSSRSSRQVEIDKLRIIQVNVGQQRKCKLSSSLPPGNFWKSRHCGR